MIKILETLVEKLNIVWTFSSKDRDKEKYKIIFNQWKKQGHRRRKKVRYILLAYKPLYGFHKLDIHNKFVTNEFTDTSNKGKINNNICCYFEEFDILIKAFTDAIYFSLIIKGGHKTKLTLSKQTVTPFIWNSEGPLLFLMI